MIVIRVMCDVVVSLLYHEFIICHVTCLLHLTSYIFSFLLVYYQPPTFKKHTHTGTSIGLVPSGRIAIAGFTDGTLRLFDLTGIFAKDKHHPDNAIYHHHNHHGKKTNKENSKSESLFDDDASSSEEEEENSFGGSEVSGGGKNAKKSMSVDSHSNQMYGAVACQIHARGVHTSLLMDVAVSEDGLYAFGGVQRGSVELAAVYLGDVESYLDERIIQDNQTSEKKSAMAMETPGLLDLIQVDRHADAKLKGFGACTRLWNGWERARSGVERPEYLLFTGKGIKVRLKTNLGWQWSISVFFDLLICYRICLRILLTLFLANHILSCELEHSHLDLQTISYRKGRRICLDMSL